MERWFLLGIFAVLLFGIGSFLGKLASINDISSRVYFFEAIGTLTIFSSFFLIKRAEILEGFSVNYYAIGMGLTWGLGTVLFIMALENSKLSIITPLTALYPAVTVLLAYLFLAERLEIKELIGVVLAIISIILILK
ncbi:MAG: EamA family transporter [Thermodesulfobacteriota bacterium]